MALQERYDAALSIIREHNEAMGPLDTDNNPAGYINPDKFVQNIKFAGGTSEERLKGMSYEDILACIPETLAQIKPVAVAKDIAKAFRGRENVITQRPVHVTERIADRMSVDELVAVYDPEEPDNAVGKRLKDVSKGQPFLVFNEDGTTDVETSRKLLAELRRGYPPRDNILVGRKLHQLYRVGEMADDLVDENPLYKGRPLRPDGTCDQTNRSWEGVSFEIRQLLRLIVESGEVQLTIDKAHDLLDMAVGDDAWRRLFDRYRKAGLAFRELERSGGLPALRIPLKPGGPQGGVTFTVGRRVDPRG